MEKTCNTCGLKKPLEEFYRYNNPVRGQGLANRMSKCKACCRSVHAAYRKRKGREFFRQKHQVYQTKYRDEIRALRSEWAKKLKVEVFAAYGNRCNCCGETEPRFLTIDHVNEDGAEHRRMIGSKGHRNSGTGNKMYGWLKRHGFPKENFQLLCQNCNVGKHFNGGLCPHRNKYDLVYYRPSVLPQRRVS